MMSSNPLLSLPRSSCTNTNNKPAPEYEINGMAAQNACSPTDEVQNVHANGTHSPVRVGVNTLSAAFASCMQGDLAHTPSPRKTRVSSGDSNKVPKLMIKAHEGMPVDTGTGGPRRSPRFQAHSPGSVQRQSRRDGIRDDMDEDDIERKRARKTSGNGVQRQTGAHQAFEDSAGSVSSARDQNNEDMGACARACLCVRVFFFMRASCVCTCFDCFFGALFKESNKDCVACMCIDAHNMAYAPQLVQTLMRRPCRRS